MLDSIEDVTDRVHNAATANMSTAEVNAARRAAITAIESEQTKQTGLRSDVVILFRAVIQSLSL